MSGEEDFYNAFATQSQSVSAATMQNINLDNKMGTATKPPKLLSIDEYDNWHDMFKNWVQAINLSVWMAVETKYQIPVDENELPKTFAQFDETETARFTNEKKMMNYLQQSVREDILMLLQHDDDCHSIWHSLRLRAQGSTKVKKAKKALLTKEFELFQGIKGESMKQMIERYCHLVLQMKRAGITKTNEELVDRLGDSLPEGDWSTYLTILKNGLDYDTLTLPRFIEKLEGHELELQKMAKNKGSKTQQDVNLYFKGSTVTDTQAPKIQTAFSASTTNTSTASQSTESSPFASFNPNISQNTSQSQNQSSLSQKGIQCNIAVNIQNCQNFSEETAKQHMSLLATVLNSYECQVAGKIGNPEMTKEDYDQIDPEEMELIDIMWCMASVVRRAQRFMEITGRQNLGELDGKLGFDKSKVTCFNCRKKGHFKRECPNRESSGNQNPFKDDYYKKAIYHKA